MKTIITKRYQAGLSLVELMVSMAVGLFLLAGVATNFIGTKNADVKRLALSEMDANAGIAFEVLRKTISHAGYGSINNIRLEKAFLTTGDGTPENPSCTGSGNVMWIDSNQINKPTKDGDTKYNDQITVVSLADNPCLPGNASCSTAATQNPAALVYTDCRGGGIPSDPRVVSCSTDTQNGGMVDPTKAKIYSSFILRKNKNSPNDRVLMCQGSRGGGPHQIVDNVEAIQYLYGVTDDLGQTFYKTAKKVEEENRWGLVRSVKVGLLLRSSKQNVLDQKSTKTEYELLRTTVKIDSADLRRLFKVYTTTINLENLNKGPIQ